MMNLVLNLLMHPRLSELKIKLLDWRRPDLRVVTTGQTSQSQLGLKCETETCAGYILPWLKREIYNARVPEHPCRVTVYSWIRESHYLPYWDLRNCVFVPLQNHPTSWKSEPRFESRAPVGLQGFEFMEPSALGVNSSRVLKNQSNS